METVRVNRDEFVVTVKKNRDDHRHIFEKALVGYRQRWIDLLERRLEEIKSGHHIDRYFSMPEPEDHTDDYDRIIAMAEMSVDEVLEFSEHEFAMYVMDQWNWKREFVETTQRYVGGAQVNARALARRIANRG